ncbi:MAG: bifunctional histidinol-phosphatase/imidazoleglycerol-phosphate dehydratase HisB [Bacteroidota bacterium]
MPKPKVLFLDRDGTLIHEPPEDYQVDSLEKLSYLPGVITYLKQILAEHPYKLVMITNQDGMGTDIFPEETFWLPHNRMMALFEGEGIFFEDVYIDKTHKAEGAPTRKPGTALLGKYMTGEYDLENSIVVGDRPSDIQLAKNLGAKGILIGRSTDDLDDEWDLEALAGTLILQTEDWKGIADWFKTQDARSAEIIRNTKETKIQINLSLDGTGKADNQTGVGFYDHMLDQLARHSGMDMEVKVEGDLHIDPHHTIEDSAIALGQAMAKALGSKKGIQRYGFSMLPMDEAQAKVALDFSGRSYLVFNATIQREKVGDFPVEMLEHFLYSFADAANCTLHVEATGSNAHHMIEAIFKGLAKAIRMAIAPDPVLTGIPSTKGVL